MSFFNCWEIQQFANLSHEVQGAKGENCCSSSSSTILNINTVKTIKIENWMTYYLSKLILWWCWPPALPRPPGCFLCLPVNEEQANQNHWFNGLSNKKLTNTSMTMAHVASELSGFLIFRSLQKNQEKYFRNRHSRVKEYNGIITYLESSNPVLVW